MLESPKLEEIEEVAVIHHRLTIQPGSNQLELIVMDEKPEIKGDFATAGFTKVWLQTNEKGLKFRASENEDRKSVV